MSPIKSRGVCFKIFRAHDSRASRHRLTRLKSIKNRLCCSPEREPIDRVARCVGLSQVHQCRRRSTTKHDIRELDCIDCIQLNLLQ